MRRRATGPDVRPLHLAGLQAALTADQIELLAAHTDVVRIEPGEAITRAGAVARQFVAIVDGEVDVLDHAGRHRVAGPGARFGGDELLQRRPFAATVTARTACTVVVAFGPAFRSAVRWRPAAQSRRLPWRTRAAVRQAALAAAPCDPVAG